MQKVFYQTELSEYQDLFESDAWKHITEGLTETFESHDCFVLLAFDWYDVLRDDSEAEKIMVYLDDHDLFFICETENSYKKACSCLNEGERNEKALYHFFVNLLKEDMGHIDWYETQITEEEDAAITDSKEDYLDKIKEYRKELLRLKRYYEQLGMIMEDMSVNENNLLSDDLVRHFVILAKRIDKYRSCVLNLRDYVTQMREAYQAQIDIEQNKLMKVFTLITAVFLPLSLFVGWYGMNFSNMPELSWKYGYPVFIGVSIVLSIFLIIYFRRKKWF